MIPSARQRTRSMTKVFECLPVCGGRCSSLFDWSYDLYCCASRNSLQSQGKSSSDANGICACCMFLDTHVRTLHGLMHCIASLAFGQEGALNPVHTTAIRTMVRVLSMCCVGSHGVTWGRFRVRGDRGARVSWTAGCCPECVSAAVDAAVLLTHAFTYHIQRGA